MKKAMVGMSFVDDKFHEMFKAIGVDLAGRRPEDVPSGEINNGHRKVVRENHEAKFIHATDARKAEAAAKHAAANEAMEVLKSPIRIRSHRQTLIREAEAQARYEEHLRATGAGNANSSQAGARGGAGNQSNAGEGDAAARERARAQAARDQAAREQAAREQAAREAETARQAEAAREAAERARAAGGGRTPPPSGGSHGPTGPAGGGATPRYVKVEMEAAKAESHFGKWGVVTGLALATVGVGYAAYRHHQAKREKADNWVQQVSDGPATLAQR